jgi:hypothetical protein
MIETEPLDPNSVKKKTIVWTIDRREKENKKSL